MDASLAAMYANLFSEDAENKQPAEPLVAFNLEGTESEKRHLVELINRIAENSPLGKAVLEEAAKTGCTLMMSSELRETTAGTANREKNIIYLNRRRPDEKLVTTLVHECRHVCQFANGCAKEEKGELDILSSVMQDRAMEADADAAAGVAAFQMAQKGDKEVLNAFAQCRPSVTAALHCETKNRPDASQDALMKAAFGAWYSNNPLKTAYEDSYYCKPLNAVMLRRGESSWSCGKSLSCEEISKRACLGGYLTDPSVLKSKDFCDLSEHTVQLLDKFFDVRQMRCGLPADKSYKNCPVRRIQQTKSNDTGKSAKTEQSKKPVPQALSHLTSLSKGR